MYTWRIPIGSEEELWRAITAEQNLNQSGVPLETYEEGDHYRTWHLHRDILKDRVSEVAKTLGGRNPVREVVYSQNLVNVDGPRMQHDGHTKNIMSKIFDLNGGNY